jgi:tRNA (guanine-N7-)-methyltransferase
LAKRKLQQYEEVNTFSNVIQPSYDLVQKGHPLRGNWAQSHFHNDHPIVLELGCGKGEYTINLAEKYPEKNFIGVDRKAARIWTGSKYALENDLVNVAFLRVDIRALHQLFNKDEVDEIWITFPDPQPKAPHAKRRLTHPRLLDQYRKLLKRGAVVHLKTDNIDFHEYTLQVLDEMGLELLAATRDLYKDGSFPEAAGVQTFYEKKFLAEELPITYLKFRM